MTQENNIKTVQLRRHKAIATGLFILMVVIYAVTTWVLHRQELAWLHYVRAFAEAAMVGALADWFAVTALFHHPLGISIPHTNLIETRKKSIGDNLGGFIVTNFLNSETVRPYIQKLDINALLLPWLKNAKNTELLVAEVSKILKNIVTRADDVLVSGFITRKSKDLLNDIRLNEVLASGLSILIDRGDHLRILDYLAEKLRVYILNNEEMVRERVKKESHFLIPGFVDNLIAAKITSGLASYLAEIKEDTHHKIKSDITGHLQAFIEDVRSNPKWQQELEGIKENILKGDKVQQYAHSIWKQIQSAIIKDLENTDSHIRRYFSKTIQDMMENLQQDPQMQEKINRWVRYNIYKAILRNASKVGMLISNTVGNWQGKELSNKLELEVGKDLQFIRINGTLVGGLVGLLIYTITQLIQNS